MARLVYTNMSVFSLGGTSYLHDLKRFVHMPNPTFGEGAGFSTPYRKGVVERLDESFAFDLQLSNLGADATDGSDDDDDLEQTSLSVSAFSLHGTNYLTYLESISFNVTSVERGGKGVSALRGYPVRTSIEIGGSLTMYMDSDFATQLFTQGQSDQDTVTAIMGAASEFYVPITLTVVDAGDGATALLQYAGNCILTPTHVVTYDELTKIECAWANRGNPTTQTGVGILGTILTDSAQPLISYSFRTATLSGNDTATGTGTGFLKHVNVTIPNSGIITMSGEVQCVAEPTWGG